MRLTRRQIILFLIGILLVAVILVGVLLAINKSSQPSPETAQTVPEITSTLDEQTRTTLEGNLEAYTGHKLEDFTVNEGSYKKLSDGIEFQAYSNTSFELYNIKTVPSDDPEFNFVYVWCAPDEEQFVGIDCELELDHV